MANHKGSEGVVHIGTSALAELRSWSLNEANTLIDDTTLNDTWETKKAGNCNWSGSATCFWDETDTNGQEQLGVGSSITLKCYLEGTGTGATYKYGTAIVTRVSGSAGINGMVERNFDFTGNGTLAQTTV